VQSATGGPARLGHRRSSPRAAVSPRRSLQSSSPTIVRRAAGPRPARARRSSAADCAKSAACAIPKSINLGDRADRRGSAWSRRPATTRPPFRRLDARAFPIRPVTLRLPAASSRFGLMASNACSHHQTERQPCILESIFLARRCLDRGATASAGLAALRLPDWQLCALAIDEPTDAAPRQVSPAGLRRPRSWRSFNLVLGPWPSFPEAGPFCVGADGSPNRRRRTACPTRRHRDSLARSI
jgi:hypothetical protein